MRRERDKLANLLQASRAGIVRGRREPTAAPRLWLSLARERGCCVARNATLPMVMLPLRALVCAAVLGSLLGLAHGVPGQGVVVGSDDASLVNASLSGLTQRHWLLGRSEWQAEHVAVKVRRDSDWCEFGKRLSAFVAAGGSRYDYVDAAFEREYSGKLVLVTRDGPERQPWCGPPYALSSDGKERYWYLVLMCRYARGVLFLLPSQSRVGAQYGTKNGEALEEPPATAQNRRAARWRGHSRARRRGTCWPCRS